MWGITSTNGDGELVQTTFEAVDGSRLGGFFVKFVPLENCSGVERFLVCGCGRRDALELVLVVALVRGFADDGPERTFQILILFTVKICK